MANDTSVNNINNNVAAINAANPAAAPKKTSEVGRDEFLQLLITQLKNQDPLEPMKNEEFAVNLAQFSQLEQLISINDKIGAGGELSSMAAYLGKEVTLNSEQIQFTNGDGGILKFDLAQDAQEVKIELLNADGTVKNTLDVGAMKAGKQGVALSAVANENGVYGFRITAITANGAKFEPQGRVAGVVSGLIPGPQPSLVVAGREIDPSEIVEVGLPSVFEEGDPPPSE